MRLATFAIIFASMLIGPAAQNTPPPPSTDKFPDGPGEKLVERSCLTCHAARVIMNKRASEDEWGEEVDKMVSRGAILSDDETDQVIEYLAAHYGPDNSKGTSTVAPGSANQPSSPQPSSRTNPFRRPPPHLPLPRLLRMPSSPVNVNTAGVQELESSLGLSETEAEAIVHHREQNGNFKTWQEVSSVPGVPAEKIKDNQKRLVF